MRPAFLRSVRPPFATIELLQEAASITIIQNETQGDMTNEKSMSAPALFDLTGRVAVVTVVMAELVAALPSDWPKKHAYRRFGAGAGQTKSDRHNERLKEIRKFFD